MFVPRLSSQAIYDELCPKRFASDRMWVYFDIFILNCCCDGIEEVKINLPWSWTIFKRERNQSFKCEMFFHLYNFRICYVLFVEKDTDYATHLWNFRENAKDVDRLKEKRAQLLYMFTNVQKNFNEQFSKGSSGYMVPCSDGSLPLKVNMI